MTETSAMMPSRHEGPGPPGEPGAPTRSLMSGAPVWDAASTRATRGWWSDPNTVGPRSRGCSSSRSTARVRDAPGAGRAPVRSPAPAAAARETCDATAAWSRRHAADESGFMQQAPASLAPAAAEIEVGAEHDEVAAELLQQVLGLCRAAGHAEPGVARRTARVEVRRRPRAAVHATAAASTTIGTRRCSTIGSSNAQRVAERQIGQDGVAPIGPTCAVPHGRHVAQVEPQRRGGLDDVGAHAASGREAARRSAGRAARCARGYRGVGPIGLLQADHERRVGGRAHPGDDLL